MIRERERECVSGDGILKIERRRRASVVLPLLEGPERAIRKVLIGLVVGEADIVVVDLGWWGREGRAERMKDNDVLHCEVD